MHMDRTVTQNMLLFLHDLYGPGPQFCFSQSAPFKSIQVTLSLALTPTLSADISTIFPPSVFITVLNGAGNLCVPFVSPFY